MADQCAVNIYEKLSHLLPIQRGNVEIPNIVFLNALLYVLENGCKWRSVPEKYGKWNSIYKRANRWSKNGTLSKIFMELQRLEIVKIRIEKISIDSTNIKVHPDAHGAAKKTENSASERAAEGGTPSFMWVPLMTDCP